MDTDKPNIGRRIKEAREKAGLDQAELGKACQTTNKVISSYENGRAYPPANTLALMAAACRVTIDFLVTGSKQTDKDLPQVNEQQDAWKISGTPPNDFEQRIIGMLRRLPADQRQAFVDLITTAYFDHMENQ